MKRPSPEGDQPKAVIKNIGVWGMEQTTSVGLVSYDGN
jgi:hypothetical protein